MKSKDRLSIRRVGRNPTARKPVSKRVRKAAKNKPRGADMRASLEALLRKISPRTVAPKKRKAVKRAKRNPVSYVICADTRSGKLYYDGARTFTDNRARAERYSDDRCRTKMRSLVKKGLPEQVKLIRQEAA